jgi:hypothetical protein
MCIASRRRLQVSLDAVRVKYKGSKVLFASDCGAYPNYDVQFSAKGVHHNARAVRDFHVAPASPYLRFRR